MFKCTIEDELRNIANVILVDQWLFLFLHMLMSDVCLQPETRQQKFSSSMSRNAQGSRWKDRTRLLLFLFRTRPSLTRSCFAVSLYCLAWPNSRVKNIEITQHRHQASSFFSPSFSFSFLASSFFSLSFSCHHELLQLSIQLFFKICKHWDLCGEFTVNCVLAFCTFLLHQHHERTHHLTDSNSIVKKHHEPWLFCFSSCCWWDCARQQLSATCCPNIVLASVQLV